MRYRLFTVGLLLSLALASPRVYAQTMDATFNNPGTVITGATDISTGVAVPTGGDHYCNGALFVYEWDPAQVTLSNPRAVDAGLWNYMVVNKDDVNHRLMS